MLRNFSLGGGQDGRSIRAGLKVLAGLLGAANLLAVYLLIAPPGGTRTELLNQENELRQQIAATRVRANQLKKVAAKVQLGSEQSAGFFSEYILPKRTAYERVIAELQRISRVSGMQERDSVHSEEPIEGSPDLTLLTTSANYEGTYENLRRFLVELDHSPMLIMLETLSAAPQAKGNQINTALRLQTVMQEEGTTGGQP